MHLPLQHGVVVAHLEAEGDGVELGQLPDDQLGVRPVQAVRLVLARRVREALRSKLVEFANLPHTFSIC